MDPLWEPLPDGRGSDRGIAPRNRVPQSEPRPLGSGCLRPLLFGYLLATGSYKFRVLDGCRARAFLAGFSLCGGGRRQECDRHVGQFGFLFRGQRLDEVRGHHHQQFVGGFLRAAAAEEKAKLTDMPATFLPAEPPAGAKKGKAGKTSSPTTTVKDPEFVGPRGQQIPKQ